MTRLSTTLCFCVPVLAALQATAADDNDRFAIRGIGVLACKTFLEQVESKDKGYYMAGGWLDGYLTAYNQFQEDTYDGTSFETTELLAAVIANHCKENPEHPLYAVVSSLVQELHADRVKRQSDPVTITVGEQSTTLYEETLKRIQQRLKELGHYEGGVDGAWGDGTSSAVRKFQEKAGIEASGFPDQATLWRLIRG